MMLGISGKAVSRVVANAAFPCALAVCALLVPAVGEAFVRDGGLPQVSLAARGAIGSFTPANADPRLVAQMRINDLDQSRKFRFTPAASPARSGRAVTIAVRIDSDPAGLASVRASLNERPGTLRVAPNAYNLGLSRGYQNFSLPPEIRQIDAPDLASFGPLRKDHLATPSTPSRFAPRVTVDGESKAGRIPRTLQGQGAYTLDLGGSYSISRNIDVIAGARYYSDRDRLQPLTGEAQDSQAVYVGTQFRF